MLTDELEYSYIGEGITDLSSMDLSSNASNIIALNFHCNRLQTLSGLPRSLASLTELNLSANLFSSSDNFHDLAFFPSLKSLDISGNKLQELESLPFLPGLTTLHVAFNSITSLSKLEENCPNLEYIDLRANMLKRRKDVAALTSLESLEEIQFGEDKHANPICSDISSFLHLFENSESLVKINSKLKDYWKSLDNLIVSTPNFDRLSNKFRKMEISPLVEVGSPSSVSVVPSSESSPPSPSQCISGQKPSSLMVESSSIYAKVLSPQSSRQHASVPLEALTQDLGRHSSHQTSSPNYDNKFDNVGHIWPSLPSSQQLFPFGISDAQDSNFPPDDDQDVFKSNIEGGTEDRALVQWYASLVNFLCDYRAKDAERVLLMKSFYMWKEFRVSELLAQSNSKVAMHDVEIKSLAQEHDQHCSSLQSQFAKRLQQEKDMSAGASKRFQTISASLMTAKKELQRVMDEKARLQEQNNELIGKHTVLVDEIDVKNTEVLAYKAIEISLQDKIAALEHCVILEKKNHATKTFECETLAADIAILKSELTALLLETAGAVKDADCARNEVLNANLALSRLGEDLANSTSACKEFQEQCGGYRQQLVDAQDLLLQQQAQLKKVIDANTHHQQQYSAVERMLADANLQVAAKEAEIEEMSERLHFLESNGHEKEATVEAELHEAKARQRQLTQRLLVLQGAFERATDMADQLERENVAIREEKDELLHTIRELSIGIQKLRTEMRGIRKSTDSNSNKVNRSHDRKNPTCVISNTEGRGSQERGRGGHGFDLGRCEMCIEIDSMLNADKAELISVLARLQEQVQTLAWDDKSTVVLCQDTLDAAAATVPPLTSSSPQPLSSSSSSPSPLSPSSSPPPLSSQVSLQSQYSLGLLSHITLLEGELAELSKRIARKDQLTEESAKRFEDAVHSQASHEKDLNFAIKVKDTMLRDQSDALRDLKWQLDSSQEDNDHLRADNQHLRTLLVDLEVRLEDARAELISLEDWVTAKTDVERQMESLLEEYADPDGSTETQVLAASVSGDHFAPINEMRYSDLSIRDSNTGRTNTSRSLSLKTSLNMEQASRGAKRTITHTGEKSYRNDEDGDDDDHRCNVLKSDGDDDDDDDDFEDDEDDYLEGDDVLQDPTDFNPSATSTQTRRARYSSVDPKAHKGRQTGCPPLPGLGAMAYGKRLRATRSDNSDKSDKERAYSISKDLKTASSRHDDVYLKDDTFAASASKGSRSMKIQTIDMKGEGKDEQNTVQSPQSNPQSNPGSVSGFSVVEGGSPYCTSKLCLVRLQRSTEQLQSKDSEISQVKDACQKMAEQFSKERESFVTQVSRLHAELTQAQTDIQMEKGRYAVLSEQTALEKKKLSRSLRKLQEEMASKEDELRKATNTAATLRTAMAQFQLMAKDVV